MEVKAWVSRPWPVSVQVAVNPLLASALVSTGYPEAKPRRTVLVTSSRLPVLTHLLRV